MKCAIFGLTLTACLTQFGCDSNPGGPSAPSASSVSSDAAAISTSPAVKGAGKRKVKSGVAPASAAD